jgi:hypothetical protein
MRVEHLRALAEFLEGLTELSNRTGVRVRPSIETCVQVGSDSLGLVAETDEDGVITYGVEQSS